MRLFHENNGIEDNRDLSARPAPAAQDRAGGAQQDRLSNTGLVTEIQEPKILHHFGLDWIVFFLGRTEGRVSKYFENLFKEFLDGQGFLPSDNKQWFDTRYQVGFSFIEGKGDQFIYVYLEGEKICSIRRITENTTMLGSVAGLYEYQVTCYGEFFADVRLGKVRFDEFWSVLLSEVLSKRLSYIISQIHVCADIEHVSTLEVWKGIHIDSPIHAKEISPIRIDPVTGIPQSVYYGQKNDSCWFARIYDKLREIRNRKRGKQKLYPQYWGKELVTRIELVFKRPVCKSFNVTFDNCFDESFLISLFKAHLEMKYVQWNILPFIEGALKESGYQSRKLERIKPDYGKITQEEKFKRLKRQALKHAEDYGVDVPYFLRLLADEIENASPAKVWG